MDNLHRSANSSKPENLQQNLRHQKSDTGTSLFSASLDNVLYFFGYQTEFFSFQNNPKNLDPSYKMDLDLWDCFGRVNLVLQQN